MSGGNVLGLFSPQGRSDCLRAVSLCLLRIRSNGWSYKQIAGIIGCSADTVENACNEKSLLGFDHIALLGFHFPDEFQIVENLWKCRPERKRTIADKLRELLADMESGRPA